MRLWVVCALVIGACAPRMRAGSTVRPWYEVRSAHFIVTTSLGLHEAEALVGQLETTWWTLARFYQLIVPGRPPPGDRATLIHLDDCGALWHLAPARGVVSQSADFLDRSIIVTCGGFDSGWTLEVLVHEVAHTFNRHYLGMHPRWLNEGLADYYASVTVEKDKVLLGGLLPKDRGRWGRRGPSLEIADPERSFWKISERNGINAAYFAARNLVHLLNNGSDDYHERFQRYLASGAGGVPWKEAWTRALGDLPPGKLDEELSAYPLRASFRYFSAAYRPPPAMPAPTVRQLGLGEVHATWAHLFLMAHTQPEAVMGHIEAAEREDSTWGDGLFWRAMAYARFPDELGRKEDYVKLLRRHLERFPDDGRARMGLVRAQMIQLEPKEYTGLDPEPLPGVETLLEDVKALAQVARSARELNLIGWYFALSHEPEAGLGFAERSVALEPSCGQCLDTLALLYHELGRDADALAAQRKAMLLLGPQNVGVGPRKRLEAYSRAAGASDAP